MYAHSVATAARATAVGIEAPHTSAIDTIAPNTVMAIKVFIDASLPPRAGHRRAHGSARLLRDCTSMRGGRVYGAGRARRHERALVAICLLNVRGLVLDWSPSGEVGLECPVHGAIERGVAPAGEADEAVGTLLLFLDVEP